MNLFHRNNNYSLPTPDSKIDERDTMFARMARKKDTAAYKDYYSKNANLKQKDDYLRSLPSLLEPGGKYYDHNITSKALNLFKSIDQINISEKDLNKYIDRLDFGTISSNLIKKIILEMGAVAAGVTDLNSKYIYSHKGRFDTTYGMKISINHPNVILFLVEMNYTNMQLAPKAETISESANQYYNAALISKKIEMLIHKLGYEAKAHYDAHYDIVLPPLAVKAGLGELGRNNILIADKYGSRVRIGAISTDLPLEYDKPKSLGADKFCEVCKKCADNCPSKALTINGKVEINGVYKWPTNTENCYTIWRKFGTDCGICMAVCPFSHKNNLFHSIIRYFVKIFQMLNRIFVLLDNLFYGKNWKIK